MSVQLYNLNLISPWEEKNTALGTVGGAPNVRTLNSVVDDVSYVFDRMIEDLGFIPRPIYAKLPDIQTLSFDYYIMSGTIGGGIAAQIYVCDGLNIETSTNGGWIHFNLLNLLDQTGGTWLNSGDLLSDSLANNAIFIQDEEQFPGQSSPFTGYKTWSEIIGIIGSWSLVYTGIINDNRQEGTGTGTWGVGTGTGTDAEFFDNTVAFNNIGGTFLKRMRVTNIVYHGNGMVADFDDGSVARIGYRLDTGILTTYDVNDDQAESLHDFNLYYIDEKVKTIDIRYGGYGSGGGGGSGAQGPAGVDGAQGVQGGVADVMRFMGNLYNATDMANAESAGPMNGDFWHIVNTFTHPAIGGVTYNSGENVVWSSSSSSWVIVGDIQTIAGPQGEYGIQGVQGVGATGPAGPAGPRGFTGYQGIQGSQGTGIQGPQGNQGLRGYQGDGIQGWQGIANGGAQGFQGWQGIQGVSGPVGITGTPGGQGAPGATGSQGNQGWQGNQGPGNLPGVQGWQGYQGLAGNVAGPQGVQGNQGNQGRQGNQGPESTEAGPQGSQGNQGRQGNQGPGNVGSQGYQGNQGYGGTQGAQGTQGWQGNQGPAGMAAGPQGAQGAQGNQGNQGRQGNQGPASADPGPQGTQGTQGWQGNQGPGNVGSQGNQGNQGRQGAQGNQGWQGNQGPGNVGSQGNQGWQGNQGPGSAGSQGNQGWQGNQGVAGTNLSGGIVMYQFKVQFVGGGGGTAANICTPTTEPADPGIVNINIPGFSETHTINSVTISHNLSSEIKFYCFRGHRYNSGAPNWNMRPMATGTPLTLSDASKLNTFTISTLVATSAGCLTAEARAECYAICECYF